jgi:hypothetical protein
VRGGDERRREAGGTGTDDRERLGRRSHVAHARGRAAGKRGYGVVAASALLAESPVTGTLGSTTQYWK